MDDLIELEDYCVFCSKYLAGTHEFNKKMHFNTCKLRKLFDSVYTEHTDTSDMDQFFMGDSCSFCLKSLKDFKSEFNKRIHIKCCKIKKETFERRDSILQLQHSQSASTSPSPASLLHSLTEACIFCTKPLGNLNSFNRKMHIEHCKIRKSLEGNIRSGGNHNKDQTSAKQGSSSGNTSDVGDHCVYCNKSFARLSDFNRRLHSEHCKSKKRKLKTLNNVINSSLNLASLQGQESSLDQVQNSLMLLASNSCPSTPLRGNHSLNATSSSEQSDNSLPQSQIGVAVCDYCEYCSRSLANLSNFNKNIHIEQCKLKQLKKAGNGLKQVNKPPRKKSKISGKDKSAQNEFCSSQILTHLDLGASDDIGSSSNPNSSANLSISNSNNTNSDQAISSNTQLNHQFNQSNATTIISLDNTTLHQLSLAASQNGQNLLNGGTHTLQITLDPNTNQIYI